MQAKEDIDEREDRIKEKKEKEENSRELKGIENQSLKKSEQPQKELGKGSDKGKSREKKIVKNGGNSGANKCNTFRQAMPKSVKHLSWRI